MTRCGFVVAAALLFLFQGQVQGVDVGTCEAQGRCRKDIAGEAPVNLIQTHASVTGRNGVEHASQDSISAPLGKLPGISEKIAPPKAALKDNTFLTALVIFLGAACAAFVQAALAMYNAMTFHILCTFANAMFVDSVRINAAQSTIYICCYYPLMDLIQTYHFRNAKRNWSLLLSYGIPLFLGLFCGLAVLRYASSPHVVMSLQIFLLFSCLMALANEAYVRIQKWRADMAAQQEASESPRVFSSEDAPEDAKPGARRTNNYATKIQEVIPPTLATPASVDMSSTFNRTVAMSCGGFTGFSLGALGIGGTFALLMLNALNIGIEEWRCTQCVAEMPLHLVRALIVICLGVINWADDWMNILGVYLGTCVGLLAGNHFAHRIPAWFLRGVVLNVIGIGVTSVMLLVSLFNKV